MTEAPPDSWWPADEKFVRDHVKNAKPEPPQLTKPPAISEDELMEGYDDDEAE